MVRFTVLGPLKVLFDDRVNVPGAPKVRQVLAILLLRRNQIVSIDMLLEELWGERPPKSAVVTAQTYVYQLRKIFEQESGDPSLGEILVTSPPGYQLRVDACQVDEAVFRNLVRRAHVLLANDRPADAAVALREALSLWDGPAIANIRAGQILRSHAVQLEEERIHAIELRIKADFLLGRHRELIGELRSLVVKYPLNEWFHAQLIEALSLAGRRAEALEAYHHLRITLDRELGVVPSEALQRLQRRILTAGLVPGRGLRVG